MGAKTRVLVVGTEPGLRFSVAVALRQGGYDVAEAGAGREGIEKLLVARGKGERFSLVVALLQRPGTWVLELMDELGRRGIAVPMLAVGDSGEKGLRKQLESRGFAEFHEISTRPAELVARVALLVKKIDRGTG
jgi:DNA-binding response OmpR family regulator